MPDRRVFISHASRDATAAAALVAGLEQAGLPCWISSRDVAPGANYQEAIVGAIRDGRAVVVLISHAANTSDEVKKELSLASAAGRAVYPVRLDGAAPNPALSYELATRQWIEGADLPALTARLATAIQGETSKPAASEPPTASALALPDKPSLVVLPFQNMSGDAQQEYFVDGLVDDITTALSCIRSLFVISRNSAFTYKGRAVDVRQVGRELGVRYVLEGSVRKAGARVRISGQLVDTATGAQLWADRFEGALEDVFDLQDQVTSSVVGAIEPQLQRAEIERALRKPTQDLGAYDYFLRGMVIVHEGRSERLPEAQALFAQAVAIDAKYAAAYGMAAFCVVRQKVSGLLAASAPEIAEGVRLARLAAATGRDDATALWSAGQALATLADELDAGALLIERACALNPNSAMAWNRAGMAKLHLGDTATAIANIARAMRLSPVDPFLAAFQSNMATAYFLAGDYDTAVMWAERAVSEQPDFVLGQRVRAVAYALSGRLDEARRAMAELLRLVPRMRVSNVGDWMPRYRRPEDVARYIEGLRLAGLPE